MGVKIGKRRNYAEIGGKSSTCETNGMEITFVEAHGGTLEVSSEENVGTIFTVHLLNGL
jgi:K+-sensing histidine kinase KdpD